MTRHACGLVLVVAMTVPISVGCGSPASPTPPSPPVTPTPPAGRNTPPVLSKVTASPSSGLKAASTIAFSAQASDAENDALTYAWEFGDGASATSLAPTHVYDTEGIFTVKLTVSDGTAAASDQATVTIKNLTGLWSTRSCSIDYPSLCSNNYMRYFSLTQSGSTVSGTEFTESFGAQPGGNFPTPGTVINPLSGSVSTTSPQVTLASHGTSYLGNPVTTDFWFVLVDADTFTGFIQQAGSPARSQFAYPVVRR